MPRHVNIRFGATAHPIHKQLQNLGIKPPNSVKVWQKDADAITRLHDRGIIHESIATAARLRLMGMINEALRTQEKVPA